MRSKLFWLFIAACFLILTIISCQSQGAAHQASPDLILEPLHHGEYQDENDEGYFCYVCERVFYEYEPEEEPEPEAELIPGELDLQTETVFVAGRYASVLTWGYFHHELMPEAIIVVESSVTDTYTDIRLEVSNILEYEMMDKALELLGTAVLAHTPEAAPYLQTKQASWFTYLILGHDGLRVLLTPDITGWGLGFITVEISYGDLDMAFALGVELGLREPPRRPMVALTFDDGPSAYTDMILDILEEVGGRATFCVLGNRVHHHPDTLIRAVEMGSEIVGHSWDHRNFTRLGVSGISAQITQTTAAIEAIIGHTPPPLIRAPYGQVNNTAVNVARDLGYSILHWSVDPKDWQNRDTESIYEVIMDMVMDGSIILLHDIHPTTAEAMLTIIPRLVEKGFQLVTASELIAYHYGEIEPGEIYMGFRDAPW